MHAWQTYTMIVCVFVCVFACLFDIGVAQNMIDIIGTRVCTNYTMQPCKHVKLISACVRTPLQYSMDQKNSALCYAHLFIVDRRTHEFAEPAMSISS